MFTMMRKTFGVIVLAGGLLGSAGCTPGQFDITGQVTYNGQTLNSPDGLIIFVGPAGEQVAAKIGTDGTYHAVGVASGLNKVAVYYVNPLLKICKPSKPRPGERPQPIPPAFLTPEYYASPETSRLINCVEQHGVFNVDLKGPEID